MLVEIRARCQSHFADGVASGAIVGLPAPETYAV